MEGSRRRRGAGSCRGGGSSMLEMSERTEREERGVQGRDEQRAVDLIGSKE
jgi:hypothetical protein